MKKFLHAFRAPRKTLLGLLLVIAAHACTAAPGGDPPAKPSKITYVAPTPAPVEIFWIDSAGNLGLRGVESAYQGAPPPEAKVSVACRASATTNGTGVLTICMASPVGRTLAKELGLEWTSPTSEKP